MAGYGNAAPYRSREGLNPRPAANMDEIQLRIDPMHADLDEDINGLHNQVAQVIGTEAKFQNEFLDQLHMTLLKGQAGLKNNVRRLNRSIIRSGSNHVVHVVAFGLVCFFVVPGILYRHRDPTKHPGASYRIDRPSSDEHTDLSLQAPAILWERTPLCYCFYP
ncbi:hypothetical protein DVH24_016739 [Malus domestica]|uniref:t-SNARE coiled-coil homology domain-containing protein n=1 Tax=Malus domestica TaxID=3750 RepID=A0A498HWI3_MALDO|nr:hypothetical protein DVH24_016739 [Malus domestica]